MPCGFENLKVCRGCRLFSSAVFNDEFENHSPPEILNTALEGVVLVMKAMSIDKVTSSPPTAARLLPDCSTFIIPVIPSA